MRNLFFQRIRIPGILIAILLVIRFSVALAGEGMWIPLLIEKEIIHEMQQKGFHLTAEDIYSVNKACLKDAVVLFGGGCTAELISGTGLILTNYHCGLSRIQQHSTVENDYITNGFWAMNTANEFPNPGLWVRFLVRMEDVTGKINGFVNDSMNSIQKEQIIQERIRFLEQEAVKNTHYKAEIEPFFYTNQYYLFVYEQFDDVRLVGAPPAAIGKFGGDTDNWMWPRQTGDFSLFRIYADTCNQSASYSPDNVPYIPKKFLKISLKGAKKGDFTMILGYPGQTEEYLTSDAIKLMAGYSLPVKIHLRGERLKIMDKYMNESNEIRIKYAAKQSGTGNAWKKWQGMVVGIKKANVVSSKENLENEFQAWTRSGDSLSLLYGNLLGQFKNDYQKLKPLYLANDYLQEGILNIELMAFISRFVDISHMTDKSEVCTINELKQSSENATASFFKDYSQKIDKQIFNAMLNEYFRNVPEMFFPSEYKFIRDKFKGDLKKYSDFVFQKSIFANKNRLEKFLKNLSTASANELEGDPGFRLYKSFATMYFDKIQPDFSRYEADINSLYAKYILGLKSMLPERHFYPDANRTMRLTYGNVEGFEPRDGVIYKYYTTLNGVMEKEDSSEYEFRVPGKLKTLFESKDYGSYAADSTMHVCFLASNHTSGGNSGSPVLDADGNLIGLNFDRNWEGTMSDFYYDPDLCRNISVDIRYVLFIIDKFAGAHNLIDEMSIIR